MITPESLESPPLHTSLDATLGDFYQDLSPAIDLVESGYHGRVDGQGLPRPAVRDQSDEPNPITVAQYALANITAFRRGEAARAARARVQLEWLTETQERDGELTGCWLIRQDNAKYPWLKAPWTSSLASGNAISALLRGWEQFGDERFRAAAEVAYHALHSSRLPVRLCDDLGDELWYEEYPAEPPVRVLNGHVYTLLGAVDYARVTRNAEAEGRWRRAAATLLAHLDDYDLGYWSAYDLRWREPAMVYYQKNVHIPQLRILEALTGEPGFGTVAARWERYLRSFICRARWFAGVRVHRWRRK
jgi:heparosan-N-sulfate-glucuronate 5-epimerase